jgi:hypothetical protein
MSVKIRDQNLNNNFSIADFVFVFLHDSPGSTSVPQCPHVPPSALCEAQVPLNLPSLRKISRTDISMKNIPMNPIANNTVTIFFKFAAKIINRSITHKIRAKFILLNLI